MKILAILLPVYFVLELTYSFEMKRYEKTSNFKDNSEIDTIKYATIKCGRGILGLSCGSLCLWNCRNYDVSSYDSTFTKYIADENFNNAEKTSSGGNDNEDNSGIKTEEESTKIKFIHKKKFNKSPRRIKLKNLILDNPTSRSNRIKREWKRRYNIPLSRISENHGGYGNLTKNLLKINGYRNRPFNRFQEPMKKIDTTYKVIGWRNGIKYPNGPVRDVIGIGRLQRLPVLVITSCSENDNREICNAQEDSKNVNKERKHQKPEENTQFSSEESSDTNVTKSEKPNNGNKIVLKKNASNRCNCTHKDEGKLKNVTNKLEYEIQKYIKNIEEKIRNAEEVKKTHKKSLKILPRLVAPDETNVRRLEDVITDAKNNTMADVTSDEGISYRKDVPPTDVKNDTLADVTLDKDDVTIFRNVLTDVKNDTVANIK